MFDLIETLDEIINPLLPPERIEIVGRKDTQIWKE